MIKQRIGVWIVGILFALTILITLLNNPKGPGFENSGTSSVILPPSSSIKVFKIDSISWGYEIFIDSIQLIFQDQIPGFQGKQRFTSQTDALKCGELVLGRIKKGTSLSVSKKELDSLNISSVQNF